MAQGMDYLNFRCAVNTFLRAHQNPFLSFAIKSVHSIQLGSKTNILPIRAATLAHSCQRFFRMPVSAIVYL